MSRVWVGMVCLLLSAGCASRFGKPHMAPPTTVSALAPGKGVVVGSFSQVSTLKYEHDNFVAFSNKSRRVYRVISMHHREGDQSFDFVEGKEAGDLFAFVLPEGVYSLENANTSSDYSRYETGAHPEFEFTVSAGEILYLGEIYFGYDFAKVPTEKEGIPYQLQLRDKWARDRALFEARYPEVDWSKARLNP